jgi:hypothetical protein
MPYYAGAVAAAKFFILSVAVLGLFTGGVVMAQTPDDNIEVMICPDPSQSSLMVREPQSDSVTDQPSADINGSIQLISQIDFFIDDVYNHTLALAHQDTSFSTKISLSPGTHTLKLVATDSCSNTVHTESMIITHEPAIQPSIGQNVDTQVEGRDDLTVNEGEVIEPSKSIVQEVFDTVITAPLVNIGRALDIIAAPDARADVKWGNVSRSAFFVFGSSLVLMSIYVGLIGAIPSRLSFLPYTKGQLMGSLAFGGTAILILVFVA